MIRHIPLKDVPSRNQGDFTREAREDIRDFLETSAVAGEIVVPKGRTVKSVCQAYRAAIRLLGAEAQIITREGRVYIIKTGK